MSTRTARASASHAAPTTPSVPPPEFVDEESLSSDATRPTEEPIEQLRAELGDPATDDLAVLLDGVSDHELIDEGHGIAIERITADTESVGRTASTFMHSASTSQKAAAGVSLAVICAMVFYASEANRTSRRLAQLRLAGRQRKITATDDLQRTANEARAQRDALAESLRGVAMGRAAMLKRINTATAPAAEGQPDPGPGRALDSLVKIGVALVGSKASVTVRRCGLYGLSTERLVACQTVADAAIRAHQSGGVSQGDLATLQSAMDRDKGAALQLLERVVRIFNAMHAVNASIPTLKLLRLKGRIGAHKARRPASPAPVATAPVAQAPNAPVGQAPTG